MTKQIDRSKITKRSNFDCSPENLKTQSPIRRIQDDIGQEFNVRIGDSVEKMAKRRKQTFGDKLIGLVKMDDAFHDKSSFFKD